MLTVKGTIDSPAMKQALEELQFYCTDGGIKVLGSYPANPAEQRRKASERRKGLFTARSWRIIGAEDWVDDWSG